MNYYEHHLGGARARQLTARQLRSERMAAARARGTHTAHEWALKVARYGNRCVRCGTDKFNVEKDHITPIYQGGSDAIDNLQPLCARCNCAKGPESINWCAYRDNHGFGSGDA